MQNTPYRHYLEASPFAEPIFFEAPQIKHFYEQHLGRVEETPNKRQYPVFTLISSPADPISLARRNFLMNQNTDLLSDSFELGASEMKIKVPETHEPVKFNKTQNLGLKEHELDNLSNVDHSDIHNQDSVSLNDFKDDDDDKLSTESERENRRLGKEEIRKRKRKSNHQLKILKWEFEKDGYWDKEKILNVAKITGLSES